jgi:hypothetical protein
MGSNPMTVVANSVHRHAVCVIAQQYSFDTCVITLSFREQTQKMLLFKMY